MKPKPITEQQLVLAIGEFNERMRWLKEGPASGPEERVLLIQALLAASVLAEQLSRYLAPEEAAP